MGIKINQKFAVEAQTYYVTPTIIANNTDIDYLGTPSTISSGQFKDRADLTTFILGNTIEYIGQEAFAGCSSWLGDLIIPESVTGIGDYAFNAIFALLAPGRGKLVIPNSLKHIPNGCFLSSYFTGNLTLPNSITSIGNDAFQFCAGFSGDLTIPNSVTYIGNGAFQSMNNIGKTFTIPNSVTGIGQYAFAQSPNLKTGNLYINKDIIDSATSVFEDCGLTTIRAKTDDASWTAGGPQTIGGKTGIFVIKDL